MNIFYTLKVLQALINNDLCILKAKEIIVGGWIHNRGRGFKSLFHHQ